MKTRKVKWRDSRLYLEQTSNDIDWEVAISESVGFVIYEDKEMLVLAGDIIDNDVRRVIVIPQENILKAKK